jgi:LmbE family N-acetylglucosaminyl deacetylase
VEIDRHNVWSVVMPDRSVVLAAAAHPDDIEFMMAGTLLLLGDRADAELHLFNIANGHCGTATLDRDEIVATRQEEAKASAELAGATWHPPLCDDIAVFYDHPTLARVAAIVRAVRPTIMLIPSPQDYMEDHQNACRLLVTAAFCRGMRNFETDPVTDPYDAPCVLYHALPHGLRDGLRQLIRPGQFVDIAATFDRKRDMLACHRSQKQWLDVSQGMDAYLDEMADMSRAVGAMSGKFELAEGWRRHSHLGFASPDDDPLADLLGDACHIDPEYESDSAPSPGAHNG